jgi:hypothetical protein
MSVTSGSVIGLGMVAAAIVLIAALWLMLDAIRQRRIDRENRRQDRISLSVHRANRRRFK